MAQSPWPSIHTNTFTRNLATDTFSYLDGRDFKIKFDEGNFATKDLHYETGISLTNLYNLHNCEKALKQDKDESNRDKAKIELKKDLEMAMEEFGEIVKAGKLEEFQNWGIPTKKFITVKANSSKKNIIFWSITTYLADEILKNLKEILKQISHNYSTI